MSAFAPVDREDWLEAPRGLRLLVEGSVTSPEGFSAGSTACGLKDGIALDIGVLVSTRPAVSALVDTTSALPSAAVVHTRSLDPAGLRGVVVNAGCANASTGSPGVEDASAMAATAAGPLEIGATALAVCSTGTIGDRLRTDLVLPGVEQAAASMAGDGGPGFAQAIQTTDRAGKAGAFRLELPSGGEVTLGAAAKGAGMIRPTMATMLAYVTTDASLDASDLQRLTEAAARSSFNRISVDGQMSPSDTLLVIANGEAPVLAGEDLQCFGDALIAVCRWLAIQMVKDGEGSEHAVRVQVVGAADAQEAERVARAVGESSLVKTAVFGRDANWGRVAQAVGAALAGMDGPLAEPRVSLDGLDVGDPAATEVMARAEYDLQVDLGRGEGTSDLWVADLGYEYVRINAEYHT